MDAQSVNNIPILPRELWIQILKCLTQIDLLKVSTVCKELYSIALDPILWKCLNLKVNFKNFLLHQTLLQRCTGLLQLQVRVQECGTETEESEEAKTLDRLVDTLVDNCSQLKSLQITDWHYLSPSKKDHLVRTTSCSIKQTTNIQFSDIGNEAFSDGTYRDKEIDIGFHNVGTADYYRRKGNPYKIFQILDSSAVIFGFNVSLKHLKSVVISLNHCRTTADGIICMTVNGKPAEMKDDGSFTKKTIKAPRYNFGMESFPVCLSLLKEGPNKITLSLDSSSPGVYWLSDAILDTVYC